MRFLCDNLRAQKIIFEYKLHHLMVKVINEILKLKDFLCAQMEIIIANGLKQRGSSFKICTRLADWTLLY